MRAPRGTGASCACLAASRGVTVRCVANSSGPILLFDGVCNLCNGSVRWLIAHDPAGRLRFASLQSEAGRTLLAQHGLPLDAMDTVVLVEGAARWTKSDAALETARRIGGAWSLAVVLKLVPRALRDTLYDWVARNRYARWGRSEECWVPTPELRARFL